MCDGLFAFKLPWIEVLSAQYLLSSIEWKPFGSKTNLLFVEENRGERKREIIREKNRFGTVSMWKRVHFRSEECLSVVSGSESPFNALNIAHSNELIAHLDDTHQHLGMRKHMNKLKLKCEIRHEKNDTKDRHKTKVITCNIQRKWQSIIGQ